MLGATYETNSVKIMPPDASEEGWASSCCGSDPTESPQVVVRSRKKQKKKKPQETTQEQTERTESENYMPEETAYPPQSVEPTRPNGEGCVGALRWRVDESELVWDDENLEVSVEELETELRSGVVLSVEEPSLFVLASTKGTLNFSSEMLCGKYCCCAPDRTTLAVIAISVMLAFLTIVLPFCLLVNFFSNTPFFDFEFPHGVKKEWKKTLHTLYLSFTAAFLLFYLLYTSLAVLDEVRIMRFYLLGMTDQGADFAIPEENKEEKAGEDQNDKQGILSSKKFLDGSLAMSSHIVKFGQHMILGESPLNREILQIGIVSKIFSLVAVFQLTFFVFRAEPNGVEMILNSVALQFLLDADRSLVSALKHTPILARWYGRAVRKLRKEADHIASKQNYCRAMVAPLTYSYPELIRQSLNNAVATKIARKLPYMMSWVVSSPEEERDEETVPVHLKGIDGAKNRSDLETLHRRCCRSEWLHRSITRFIYVYGAVLIVLQIIGSTICNASEVCTFMNRAQGFDDD